MVVVVLLLLPLLSTTTSLKVLDCPAGEEARRATALSRAAIARLCTRINSAKIRQDEPTPKDEGQTRRCMVVYGLAQQRGGWADHPWSSYER